MRAYPNPFHPSILGRAWARRRTITVFAVLLVAALVGALSLRTAMFRSRQENVSAAKLAEVDEKAVERLAQALKFKTVSAPSKFKPETFQQFHAFLVTSFSKFHDNLERIESEGRDELHPCSLLYRWRGSDDAAKPILLMSHLDVVPVSLSEQARWTHDAWGGVIRDGYIWGRGALDVKCGAMSMFEAVEYLLAKDFQPACDVYFAFGHDEEVGGAEGNARMARLLQKRGVRFRFVLDEGGVIVNNALPGLHAPLALVGIAEKGYATVRLSVDVPEAGRGHSSMPPPQTAVGIMSAAIAKLEKNPRPASLAGPVGAMLDHVGPEMDLPQRFVLANRDVFRPLLLSRFSRSPTLNALIRTTTAATVIEGGYAETVLPSDAKALINFRLLPGDTARQVLDHVMRVVDDRRVAIELSGLATPPSSVSNDQSEDFRTLHRTIRQLDPKIVVAPGLSVVATDSRHYEHLTVNTFRFLPMRLTKEELKRIHGIDERISEDNYREMVQFMIMLLQNAAGERPER